MNLSEHTITKAARKLNAKNEAKRGISLPPLILITDHKRQKDTAGLIKALPPDALVILRDYDHPSRAKHLAALAALCHKRQLPFLVADDEKLALELGASGIHLPSRSRVRLLPLRCLYPGWLITVAAHGAKELSQAKAADAALISPVFATGSHPGAAPLGVLKLRKIAARVPTPLYALGGVSLANARQLSGVNLAGIATVSGFEPLLGLKKRRKGDARKQ